MGIAKIEVSSREDIFPKKRGSLTERHEPQHLTCRRIDYKNTRLSHALPRDLWI
jgi:hypothetical protein